MSRCHPVELTNMCAIVDKQRNKVVVQKRIKSYKGIAFPGGHVEMNESVIESTIREIKEETGLTVSNLTLKGIKDWNGEYRYLVFLFYTETFSGDLLKNTEEGEIFWQDIDTLSQQDLAEDFMDMANIMLSSSHTEIYYGKEGEEWIKELL